jgi:hypothetical protein
MVEAKIEMPGGAIVTVSGSEAEVGRLVRMLSPIAQTHGRRKKSVKGSREGAKAGSAITDYVVELREAGQFDKPKGLTEVKDALAVEGHIVPITTLSGVMLGLARAKQLRRFKDGGTWKYVRR